ncbi:hypothetical protein NGL66_09775 [Lactococcus lactis subsp. lactis]
MMIVANDSITVSNINDGTITHTAWSYSADGTDRFTTVYPNLNLLVNSSAKTKDGFFKSFDKVENDYGEVTLKGTNTYAIRNMSDGFSIKPRDYKPNDTYTMSMDVMFTSWNLPVGTTLTEFWIGQRYTKSTDGSIGYWKQICYIDLPRDPSNMLNQWIRITKTSTVPPLADPSVNTGEIFQAKFTGPSEGSFTVRIRKPKQEPGSTATPWMPSASEVTTADWPSYIGQYSDFTATASTDPTKYAPWTVFKGIDGNNGRGIVSSEQKYQVTTTPAKPVDPWENSVWQTTQPTTTATNKYLWSITRTTFNLAPLTQDIVEQKAVYGDKGTDGDPGKVVSDTEPTTRFKGLTWKYSGTADLTASDGTVIHLNTEYYYNGTNWMINYLSANNIEANSIKADKIDAKNLTITDGEFISTTTNGPVTTSTEIKDNHIAISKTDGTVNTRNDIALDSEQGLAQKFTNINTGFYRTAGINYQGPFTSDSDGNYAQLTPQGTKLSTDVPWTTLSPMGGFSGGLIRFAVKNGVAHFSLAGLSCPPMTAGNWIKCAQLPSGSIAIPSENQVTAAFTNATVWGFYVSKSGGLYLQSTSNSPALNGFVNASNSYPIG